MHHVIIGGGPAATNAIETIRDFDGGASKITLVSDEPAHSRMALPYWLSQQVPREQVLTGDPGYFRTLKVETLIGRRAARIEPQAKRVLLDDGTVVTFDDLLIATGASPIRPATIEGADLAGVHPLWRLDHTQAVLEETAGIARPRAVLIGAGFIGFIVLNAMYKRGWQLAVVEREPHVLPRMLDAEGAQLVERWLASKYVAVHCGTTVRRISEADDGSKILELADGRTLPADVVILAVGIRPNVGLVEGTGIAVEQGILIDDRCRTNVADIYAGGDVAQGPALYSGKREIHAIQPTAVDHGRVAGANMAGHEVHYAGSLLMNILDVCGLQCASFGNWGDAAAEAMTISQPGGPVYRKLLWTGEQITGAIFIGRASDLGMLNDVGMVKGIMQTETSLGPWKAYLRENPFDVRRPYVATKVAAKLVETTLTGRPSPSRRFRFGGAQPATAVGAAHQIFVDTKPQPQESAAPAS